MVPYLGDSVLDYGCGDGKVTRVLKCLSPDSQFVAYDCIDEAVQKASVSLQDLATVVEEASQLEPSSFDTGTLICSLHHDHGLIEQVDPYLKDDGYLIILDHDKSHLSETEFSTSLTDADRAEINTRGFQNVFQDHTRMTVDQCCEMTETRGYTTIKALDHTYFKGYPFYVWIGQKNI